MNASFASRESKGLPKEIWIFFSSLIEQFDDFYQLLALTALVEARLP